MTQLKMQQHQHHINIINQPQKIFTSTQDHWKDNTIINNFHVYTKVQLKTETYEKYTRTRNRQSATEQFARRAQLLVVASSLLDHSLGEQDHSPMASDDKQLYEQTSVFTQKPQFRQPKS